MYLRIVMYEGEFNKSGINVRDRVCMHPIEETPYYSVYEYEDVERHVLLPDTDTYCVYHHIDQEDCEGLTADRFPYQDIMMIIPNKPRKVNDNE